MSPDGPMFQRRRGRTLGDGPTRLRLIPQPPNLLTAYLRRRTRRTRPSSESPILCCPRSEAVGKQWFTFRHVSIGTRRLFLPVIVTNATLYTCTFDAEVECRHQVPGLRQRRRRRDEGEGWLESSHEPVIGCQELTSVALGQRHIEAIVYADTTLRGDGVRSPQKRDVGMEPPAWLAKMSARNIGQ